MGRKYDPNAGEGVSPDDLQRQLDHYRELMKEHGVQDPNDEYYLEDDGTKNFDKSPTGKWKKGRSPEAKSTQFTSENRPRGGRPKGSKNKKTLRQELLDSGEMTPAQFLTTVMNDDSQNIKVRMQAATAAAGFYDAKLSSIEMEVSGNEASPFQITIADAGDLVLCKACDSSPCVCDDNLDE